MIKLVVLVSAAVMLLQGCATELRADAPVRPISYQLPAYRAERSIGNLRRLAILPVRARRTGQFAQPLSDGPYELHPSSRTIGEGVAAYLSNEKGYETVLIEGDAGDWRQELLAHPEHGSIEELQAAWGAARSEGEVKQVVQRLGRALGVDGVLLLWMDYSTVKQEEDAKNVGAALLNLFLLNGPLFYAMSHTAAEAVIFETATGQPAWRIQLSGAEANIWQRNVPVSPQKFFANLENAIPAQVIR